MELTVYSSKVKKNISLETDTRELIRTHGWENDANMNTDNL